MDESPAQLIARVRALHGLTQQEFAEKCGVYQNVISNIENGKWVDQLRVQRVVAKARGMDFATLHVPPEIGESFKQWCREHNLDEKHEARMALQFWMFRDELGKGDCVGEPKPGGRRTARVNR